MISESAGDRLSALKAELRQARMRELDDIPADALAWLALPPFWTVRAARAASFPTGSESLDDWLERLDDAQLIEVLDSGDDPEDRRFQLPSSARSSSLAHLRERHVDLVRVTVELGRALRSAEEMLPPVLKRFLALARKMGRGLDDAADWLREHVRELCDHGHAGDALDWIDSAGQLASAVGGSLVTAVRLARYRTERSFRQEQDRTYLSHFLERREQLAAFEQLIHGPDDEWALHYLGMGGVGKTMLIRHIAAEAAPKAGAALARIDFDYLSAAYPATEPGHLIGGFLVDLLPAIEEERQETLLRTVQSQIVRLHERLRDDKEVTRDPLAGLRLPELDEMLAWFAELCSSLGKVVLVLDTCEELTKVPPVKGVVPSVEASFELLERLHARAPSLRVVFAGRRLLTSAGREWRADESFLLDAPLSAPRPYLGLHALRGFDGGEAGKFLDRRLHTRRADAALRTAILAASPDEGVAAQLIGQAEDPTPRYSPFNLELHADWVERDSKLTPADLGRRDIDPYIEMRIVRRVGPLATILPHVALLRSFEAKTLGPTVAALGLPHNETLAQLAAQEWIDVVRRPDDPPLLTVRRQLQDRLLRCLEQREAFQLDAARALLAPQLARELERRPLSDLEPSLVDAALRLAARDAAPLLWDALELRLAREQAWGFALNLTRVLTAPGGAAEATTGLLAAAVRATQAAALLVTMPGEDVGGAWDGVELALGSGEEAEPLEARILRYRARLGELAATVRFDRPTASEQDAEWSELARLGEEMRVLPEPARERLAGGFLAANEALVELAEATPWQVPGEARAQMFRLAGPLGIFQDVLDLRLRTLRGETRLADWQVVLEAADAPARATALDWGGPDSLRERVRLEAVRALFHEADELPDVKWRDQASEAGGLDGERLRSALLERQLSRRALAFEELFALEQTMGSMFDARPRCRAHLRFPPFFVTLVIGWVGLGDATRAGSIISQAPEPWSARLLHMMTRRLRLTRSAERLQRLLADRRKPDFNAVCALALNAAVDDKDLAFLPAGQRLAVAEARDAEQCLALVDRGAGERPESDDPLVQTRFALVGLELTELSRYTPAPQAPGEDVPLPTGESPDRWAEAMRVALVRDALMGILGGPEWRAQAHASRRAAGFLALEEGELLARRLPERAVPLLVLAADWLEDAGDLLSTWQALLCAAIAERHAGESTLRERLAQLTARVEIDKLLPGSSGWHARCAAYFGAATKEPTSRVIELDMRPFLRGAPRTPSVGLRVSSWTQRHKTILLTVAVASIALAGAIYAFFWLYRPWAEDLLAEIGAPRYVSYFGPIVLLFALTQLSKLAGWAGSTLDLVGVLVRLYQRSTQSVQIDGKLAASLTLALRHRTAFGFYTVDSAAPELDDDAEHASGFARLSAEMKTTLATLQRRRFGPRLPAPLSLPRAASGACVEGWLAAAAATPADALLYYRQVGGQAEPAVKEGLHTLAPPALVVEVRKAWGQKPPPIMHLVARAVRTARGAAIVQVVASASQATRTVKLGDEVTLLAEDVPGFEGRLLVLQAEPDESIERSGADRRAAAVQRELAASFMDAGAAAVLVLPALPRALGLRIVHALSGVFGSSPPDRARLLAGLRRAREIVAGEARLGPEPIWDVTLLLRE